MKKEKIKLGLIGENLSHSLSPKIHKLSFESQEETCDYSLVDISKEDLKDLILVNKENYHGFNVTRPHKVEVMKYLDEVSEEARIIGAVNTIIYEEGKIKGYNTDYLGFKRTLEDSNINIKNKRAVLLGYGGAARAVLKCLIDEKAQEILIVVRNIPKVQKELGEILNNLFIKLIDFKALEEGKEEGYLLINSTPIGMYPNINESPVSEDVVKRYDNLVDLIYNPHETLFLKYGRENNKLSVNGMFMLVAQAIASEEIWMKRDISNRIIKDIITKL